MQTNKEERSSTHRLAVDGMLVAAALILHFVEAQLPSPVPVPGVRLGLANVITLYAVAILGPAEALAILLCRIILGGIFGGALISFLLSLTGGICCFCVMALLKKWVPEKMLWLVSVFGALGHNVGQIAMAAVLMHTTAIVVYLPFLLLSGIITGLLTGLVATTVIRRIP